MPDRVLVAADGWEDLADAEQFYPDDLPEEWRLSYFANANSAVYLPRARWGGVADDRLAAWGEGVHPRFRFYLGDARRAGDQVRNPAISRAVDLLGDALGAFVTTAATRGDRGARLLAPVAAAGAAQGASTGTALFCPEHMNTDLRAARSWLQSPTVAEAPGPCLIILRHPSSMQLAAWHSLLDLLGLS